MNKKLNVVFVPLKNSSQSFKPKIEQKSDWYRDWERAKEEREERFASPVAEREKDEK